MGLGKGPFKESVSGVPCAALNETGTLPRSHDLRVRSSRVKMVEELRLSRPTTYLELLHNKQRREQRNLRGGDPELDKCRPNDLGMPLDHTTSPHFGQRGARGASYRTPRAFGDDGNEGDGSTVGGHDTNTDANSQGASDAMGGAEGGAEM